MKKPSVTSMKMIRTKMKSTVVILRPPVSSSSLSLIWEAISALSRNFCADSSLSVPEPTTEAPIKTCMPEIIIQIVTYL